MKIKQSYMIYILCIVPYLEMARLGGIKSINIFFLIAKIIVAGYAIGITTLNNQWNAGSITLSAYCLTLIIPTIIFRGSIIDSISDSLAMLVPFLLISYYGKKLDFKEIAKPIIFFYSTYALLTSIQLIRIPFTIFKEQSLRDSYLFMLRDEYGPIFALGDPKRFVFMLLPLFYLLAIRLMEENSKKIRILFYCIIGISLFDVVYVWSISALLVLVIFLILIIANDNKIINKVFNWLNIWNVLIILGVANVLLLFTSFLSLFSDFFELFGKTITLSGRTFIWAKAIPLIQQSLIIGHGYNLEEIKRIFYNFVHLHNLIINILYTGGFIRLAVFVSFNVFVAKKIDTERDSIISKFTVFAIMAFLILGLTDTPDYGMLYAIYAFGFIYSDYITTADMRRKKK